MILYRPAGSPCLPAAVLGACLSVLAPAASALEVASEGHLVLGIGGVVSSVVPADLDGDGKDEVLVVSNDDPTNLSGTGQSTLTVLAEVANNELGVVARQSLPMQFVNLERVRRPDGDVVVVVGNAPQVPGEYGHGYRISLYSGMPPSLKSSTLSAFGNFRLPVYGDLSGNGGIEAIEYSKIQETRYEVRLRSLLDGQVKWQAEWGGPPVAVYRLPGEAASRVVISGVFGNPATSAVLDAATGLALNTANVLLPRMAASTLIGNFDLHVGDMEMAEARTDLWFWTLPQLEFAGSIHLGGYPGAVAEHYSVSDIDRDGVDEILIGRGASTVIVSPVTGAVRSEMNNAAELRAMRVGDVLAREGQELLQVVENHLGVQSLEVRDPRSWELIQRVPVLSPGSAVAKLAELDPAEGPELVVAFPTFEGVRVEVRSTAQQELLRAVEVSGGVGSYGPNFLFVEASSDGSADTLGLLLRRGEERLAYLMDSASLETLAEFRLWGEEVVERFAVEAHLEDVDQDGRLDFLIASRQLNTTQVQFRDALTGELRWQRQLESQAEGKWWIWRPLQVAVRPTGAADDASIFVADESRLDVLDASSGDRLRSRHGFWLDFILRRPADAGGACSLIQYGSGVLERDCDSLAVLRQIWFESLQPVDWLMIAQDGGYLVRRQRALLEFTRSGRYRKTLATLPSGVQAKPSSFETADATRVAFPVDAGVYLVEFAPELLFHAGFEAR